MPYKDPEKRKALARVRAKRWRETRRADREKALEDASLRKVALQEKKRAWNAAELEERSIEMGLQINRCPRCKSAGAAKVKGSAYLAGCSRQKCEKWVGGDEAVTGTTMAAAIEGWNKWTEEEMAEQEEARRLEAEMAAEVGEEDAPVEVGDLDEEGALDGEPPDEDEDLDEGDDDGDEGGAGDEDGGDEDAGDDEPEEGGDEDAGEEGEAYAQFELVLDGVRYIMVPDEEGCDGCAFCMAVGRRQVCASESSEDFKAARTLCGELQGQWREAEEE